MSKLDDMRRMRERNPLAGLNITSAAPSERLGALPDGVTTADAAEPNPVNPHHCHVHVRQRLVCPKCEKDAKALVRAKRKAGNAG